MTNSDAVLITGGAGFLGSHLSEHYLRKKVPVIAVDNFATGSRSNVDYLRSIDKDGLFTFVEADVCKPWESWAPTKRPRLTKVLHFASPASPPHYQRLGVETMWVNTLGLSNAMDLADHDKARVVFASTSEIYGDPEVTPQPETYRGCVNTWGPRSCYDEAKRFGEALIYTRNVLRGTNHGCVRIFNTYGPRMNPADGRVVINLLVQAIKKETLTIYGTGAQTRSFCYVDDLVAGITTFAATTHTGPVNIGNDKEFSILELTEKVRELFPDRKLNLDHLPLPKDDPQRRRPDLTLARKVLNWEPRVPLVEGLAKMRAWLELPGTL